MSRIAKLKAAIGKNKDIFDPVALKIQPKESPGLKKLVRWPDVSRADHGIPLAGGVGSIAVEETIDKGGQVVEYVYKFISGEYKCVTSHEVEGQHGSPTHFGEFAFHYDKCEDNKPHPPHISLDSYPSIRYFSREIRFDEFLDFVRETFFVEKGGVWSKKNDPIWFNRVTK